MSWPTAPMRRLGRESIGEAAPFASLTYSFELKLRDDCKIVVQRAKTQRMGRLHSWRRRRSRDHGRSLTRVLDGRNISRALKRASPQAQLHASEAVAQEIVCVIRVEPPPNS